MACAAIAQWPADQARSGGPFPLGNFGSFDPACNQEEEFPICSRLSHYSQVILTGIYNNSQEFTGKTYFSSIQLINNIFEQILPCKYNTKHLITGKHPETSSRHLSPKIMLSKLSLKLCFVFSHFGSARRWVFSSNIRAKGREGTLIIKPKTAKKNILCREENENKLRWHMHENHMSWSSYHTETDEKTKQPVRAHTEQKCSAGLREKGPFLLSPLQAVCEVKQR